MLLDSLFSSLNQSFVSCHEIKIFINFPTNEPYQMCGIFGFCDTGERRTQEEVSTILIEGLKKIEYRGYDSAGMCIFNNSEPVVYQKAVGKVESLNQKLKEINSTEGSKTGKFMSIAHTRWATHGESSERNAHPVRSDSNGTFFVVHNGIISNYKKHKEFLKSKGYVFETDTDTEIAAKLCLYHYEQNSNLSFLELVKKVLSDCEGQYAFLFLSSKYPGEMIATQSGAPMIIGIRNPSQFVYDSNSISHEMKAGEQTDFIVSSDISAIIEHTLNVVYINKEDIAVIRKEGIKIYNPSADVAARTILVKLDTQLSSVEKGEFPHYMLKEIYEQVESITNTTRNRIDFENHKVRLDTLEKHIEKISKAKRYIFVACGTSYHSSLATKKIFETLSGKPVIVETASNFLDMEPMVDENDVAFFISQSGETADTISAMNYCISKNVMTVGITNTRNSSIARNTSCEFDVRAGIEKGVASTKAYTSQFLSIILIAVYISQTLGTQEEKRVEIIKELERLPAKVKLCLEINLEKFLELLSNKGSILVVGRGNHAPTCLEGSLKIKEISYIHSEGILAGELKHGPLALVTPDIGIIMVITNDKFYDKSHNAFEQICARGGKPIVICSESIKDKYEEQSLIVPDTIDCLQGVLAVIPLQMISYKLAVKKGFDPDFPRNLAKSVTVE